MMVVVVIVFEGISLLFQSQKKLIIAYCVYMQSDNCWGQVNIVQFLDFDCERSSSSSQKILTEVFFYIL